MGVMGSFLKVTGAATLIIGIQLATCPNAFGNVEGRVESAIALYPTLLRSPVLSDTEPEPPRNGGPGSSNSGGTQWVMTPGN